MEKKLPDAIATIEAAHPEAQIEVWAEDEHRIGLHPVNRIVWVPIGEVPLANVNWKYKWLWLVGFNEAIRASPRSANANQSWETLDQLEEVIAHRCRVLMERPDIVRGVSGYHWWLDAVS